MRRGPPRRLGAEPLIIYRRTREQMPAHDFEADEAIEEGVKIHWLRTIKQIDGTTFTVEVMELDEHGFPQPTGEIETLEADSLILALGQDTDTAFLEERARHRVPARTAPWSSGPTCRPAVPACSPAATWCRSSGPSPPPSATARRPPAHIDAWLRGTAPSQQRRSTTSPTFEMLRLWYHAEAKQRGQSTIDIERRRQTFDEVVGGLDADGGAVRGAALPVVRQLLRVRRLLLRVPGTGRHQARARAGAIDTTSTSAPAARSATTSARAARSRWSPKRS